MLTSGTRLGQYEIVSPLGNGGMGEVYLARDIRLKRRVAVKTLRSGGSATTEMRTRFEREARAISSLSHPHICTLYDFGEEDGVQYLVMEYLEGESLDVRLRDGTLSIAELIRIGHDIADALASAHGHGIIHRDLKPSNIVLTKNSGAKILDFGVARQVSLTDDAPTITVADVTAAGMIVGTLKYMAPEQLHGRQSDARSDIFSLGLVLYEMATGRPAFTGDTSTAMAAAIIHTEPAPLEEARPDVPESFARIVKLCLAKNPDQRWQSARDIELQLRSLHEDSAVERRNRSSASDAVADNSHLWRNLFFVASICALLIAGWAVRNRFVRATAPSRTTRASLLPPPTFSFLPYNFALSPDGSRLAFVAIGNDGKTSVWVRLLSSGSAQQVPESQGGLMPFWAPDNRRLGFFVGGEMRAFDTTGGPTTVICHVLKNGQARGATWNRDDVIVFGSAASGPMYRVSAAGGTPEPITQAKGSQAYWWPSFLPDGTHFLYFVQWSGTHASDANGVFVGSLDGKSKKLSRDITGNVVYSHGYLLYVEDRNLMARPFSLRSLDFTGPAVRIIDQEIRQFVASSASDFSASDSGTIVFRSTLDSDWQLTWVNANGEELGTIPQNGCKDPSLSPNGELLALACDDSRNGQYYIRVLDLKRNVSLRLTEGGREEFPTWSPDGKRVAFLINEGARAAVGIADADGRGAPAKLFERDNFLVPNAFSPDGRNFAFMDFAENGPPQILSYSMRDHSFVTLESGAEAQYSPDGKWISFVAGSAGSFGDVFVQSLESNGKRLAISNEGGAQPRWSHDGRKLYYISPERKLVQVEFSGTGSELTPSAPRPLFQTRISSPNFTLFQYDLTADGSRFVINSFPKTPIPLTIVTDWNASLQK